MSVVDFLEGLAFRPDPFQLEAIDAVTAGESVVVAAPTGAGKTLVAEAAIVRAVEAGGRAFYTTPLKALSNQKYADLRRVYGSDGTGLLTGDNSINGDAAVVVMTTEVLRNMIYADAAALHDLETVVLDEVHYLQDPFRGAVWEEIIIHLSQTVQLVALSATVSNAGQFTDWVRSRRGPTRLVMETARPVPLQDLYLLEDRLGEDRYQLYPTFVVQDGRRVPNPAVPRLLRSRGARRRFSTPRREAVIRVLDDRDLLPAIYFIFSRAGCDAAAQRLAEAGLGLTTAGEAAEIRRRAEAGTAHIGPDDLRLLDYGGWVWMLEQGVGAHHAGLVPAFKETVEELFGAGLVKVVFATETLSLGINMPARSVVLESLSKFTGEAHQLLAPGDYTQLTGRAGRRGIDESGSAVVLFSPYVPFERVAAIAGTGSHPLRSSFRPTYNMAVNLVANYPRRRAEELLRASFAQFQRAGESAVLEANVRRNEAALADYEAGAQCELGDVFDYLDRVESGEERLASHRETMREFARAAAPGDVLELPGDRRTRYVVLSRSWTSHPRLLLFAEDARVRRLRPEQLPPGTARVGSLVIPEPYRPGEGWFKEALAAELAEFEAGTVREVAGVVDGESHPVAACPDAAHHLRWARRVRRLRAEISRQRTRLERVGSEVVEQLAATLDLLESWGYTRGWSLTERGERLRFVYSELDLLVAEAAAGALLDGLSAAELAGMCSAFVFEPRAGAGGADWPTTALARRGERLAELAADLAAAERIRRLPESRPPDPGFAATAYHWTAGASLEQLWDEDRDLVVGDFVRTCRQLLDLLRQLRDAYPDISSTAARAAAAIDRGVVAAGGVG